MPRTALEKVREDPRGTAARILDAAEEVFAEQGYRAASTREMARRADIPFGALHYHWGSKKQLWEAVFKRLGDRTRETIMRTLRPGNTVRELADNLVDAFLDLMIERPNTTRLAYRMCLEHSDLHLKSVRDMFSDLGRFGIASPTPTSTCRQRSSSCRARSWAPWWTSTRRRTCWAPASTRPSVRANASGQSSNASRTSPST